MLIQKSRHIPDDAVDNDPPVLCGSICAESELLDLSMRRRHTFLDFRSRYQVLLLICFMHTRLLLFFSTQRSPEEAKRLQHIRIG